MIKLFKKILFLLLILLVLYVVSIFLKPEVASSIDNMLGMPWFSENIRNGKDFFDSSMTNTSMWEFRSWALDIKDKFVEWVSTTKDTIDDIRWWAQAVEDTYNSAIETYNELKWTLEDWKEKVEQIQWVINSVTELTWTWSN